jgi:hypothetical protein
MLMDEANYLNYQVGQQFSYYGGQYWNFPVRVTVPHAGTWHLVVDTRDLGNYEVQASYQVVPLFG